jgi:tetratricopeptide (TPR) repeat protein
VISARRRRARALAMTARGRELFEQGRWQEAASVHARAVSAAERAFGNDTVEVAEALNSLGISYKFLARFSDAGPLYQRALAIMLDRVGPAHTDVASIYHNLGGLEHAAGNWARGEPFAREALRIRTRALGRRDPTVAADMIALAALLDPQKKFDESERLYVRAIAILEREHGPDHPEIAVALNNLAAVHQARGRPGRAERLYDRAIAIQTRAYGGGHPQVGFFANNLAVLLKTRGRFVDAERWFRRALDIFTRALGPRHPNVGVCLENYAEALRRLKRRREAAACVRRARRILGRVEAVNDDGVAITATINPLYARFRLIVGPSPINRLGVFAEEPIPANRPVIEYTGERISRRESARRWDPARSYLFKLDAYWRIDGAIGGSGAEYINHSCDPNMRSRLVRGQHIVYYSRRAVEKGEELTVDYKYPADLTAMRCRCGARTCRGTMNLPRRRAPTRRRRQVSARK